MSIRKEKESKRQKTNANKHTESNMATAAFIQCECSATTFMAALFSVYDENGIDDIICAIQASFRSSSSQNSACCVVYFFHFLLDCINDLRRRRDYVCASGRRWKWVFGLSGILLLTTMTCCESRALSESWGAVRRCWLRFLRGLRCDARLLQLGIEPLNKFHSLNWQQFIIRRATELLWVSQRKTFLFYNLASMNERRRFVKLYWSMSRVARHENSQQSKLSIQSYFDQIRAFQMRWIVYDDAREDLKLRPGCPRCDVQTLMFK